MKNNLLYWIGLSLGLAVILQACGKKWEPQESCNFVQNGNEQRVSWKANLPVQLFVHESLGVDNYPAVNESIEIWNKVFKEKFNQEAFVIVAQGVTGDPMPKKDGYSTLYLLDTWESNKSQEQARTTIYWTGRRIYETDIRINGKDFRFANGTALQQGQGNKVHVVSLLIHELGHSLGFSHSDEIDSIMYPSLASGKLRNKLNNGDLTYLDCEYKPQGTPNL